MADLFRADAVRSSAARADAAGEAKVEQLLLAGLDRYFAGEYEQAISLWSRVLFLDRSHGRARAYIERARAAIAERQRESEELVHRGVDAFGRGDAAEARSLLISALDRGGPHEVALTFLDRLDRLPPPPAPSEPAIARPTAPPRAAAPRTRAWPRPRPWLIPGAALILALVVGGMALHRSWTRLAPLLLGPDAPGSHGPARNAAAHDIPPLLRPADVALARARTLQMAGRLHEALAALDAIDPGDRLGPEADRLRSEMQRVLLATPMGGGGDNR